MVWKYLLEKQNIFRKMGEHILFRTKFNVILFFAPMVRPHFCSIVFPSLFLQQLSWHYKWCSSCLHLDLHLSYVCWDGLVSGEVVFFWIEIYFSVPDIDRKRVIVKGRAMMHQDLENLWNESVKNFSLMSQRILSSLSL